MNKVISGLVIGLISSTIAMTTMASPAQNPKAPPKQGMPQDRKAPPKQEMKQDHKAPPKQGMQQDHKTPKRQQNLIPQKHLSSSRNPYSSRLWKNSRSARHQPITTHHSAECRLSAEITEIRSCRRAYIRKRQTMTAQH